MEDFVSSGTNQKSMFYMKNMFFKKIDWIHVPLFKLAYMIESNHLHNNLVIVFLYYMWWGNQETEIQ